MVLVLPGMFEFAAPPRTGVHWFVKACREAGLMLFPDEQAVLSSGYLWGENRKQNEQTILRVTLVRHPCDWLRSMWDAFRDELDFNNKNLRRIWLLFANLPKSDFESFVVRYLETMQGKITEIFDSYKADSRLRLEDMPWALVELLESFKIEQYALDRVIALPRQNGTANRTIWDQKLFDAVLSSEREFCQALDYY